MTQLPLWTRALHRNYNVIMKANVVRIGNSRGVRIPKAILELVGLGDQVEIQVRGSQLLIQPARHPRAGWDGAFAAMARHGDDTLIDPLAPTKWDESEWRW